MPRRPRKPELKRPSFKERMTENVRTTVGLSRTLVNEPKTFPREVLKLAKHSFRTLWNARGGGLYACGFVVAFVWLELRSLVSQVVGVNGVGSFIVDELIQVVFRFSVQSLENTMLAFIWPAHLLQVFKGYGFVVLAVLFFVFPRYIKGPLTHWLLHEDAPPDAAPVTETRPA